jgi:hypothetical protein
LLLSDFWVGVRTIRFLRKGRKSGLKKFKNINDKFSLKGSVFTINDDKNDKLLI